MIEDDDELADLLADEDRVREALLAAVDEQLVPPVRTDFSDILQRGRRRARLQVLAASAAAVVLIAAVALGATALGRLGDSDRVSAATGPLPVSSQTITTTTQPTTPGVPTSAFTDAACVYPGLIDGQKWVPLNDKQSEIFLSSVGEFTAEPLTPIVPAVADALPPVADVATRSVEVYAHGQLNLLTISATGYSGPAAIAAEADSSQADMPQDCIGVLYPNLLGDKAPMVNAYTPIEPGAGPRYQRVQVYTTTGVRYDVTEVVDPTGIADYNSTPQLSQGAAASASADAALKKGLLPPALTPAELAQVALHVSATP